MKVLLRENISKVGSAGDVKEVADGFARNFLLPRNLASTATAQNLKRWEVEKDHRQLKVKKSLESAQNMAQRLQTVSVELYPRSGREGHLFGSITNNTIAQFLAEKGISLDKKDIVLEKPIKSLGEYKVTVHLHPEVSVPIQVNVLSKAS